MRLDRTLAAALLAGGLALGACQDRSTTPPRGDERPKPGDEAAAGAGPAGPVADLTAPAVEGERRYVVVVGGPAQASLGESGTFRVEVKPEGGWHMNLDYPTSLELEPGPGLALAKESFKKADASRLDEDLAGFDVEFTAAEAGDRVVEGTFKFAICQDTACMPVEERVKLEVAVR